MIPKRIVLNNVLFGVAAASFALAIEAHAFASPPKQAAQPAQAGKPVTASDASQPVPYFRQPGTNMAPATPAAAPVPSTQATKPAVQPAAVAAAAAPAATPGAPAKPAKAAKSDEEQLTVISSDKLTFDYKKKYAYFENNVVVTDPKLKLLADKMTVNFDESNKVSNIMSTGSVVIIMEDKKSRSDKATYNVPTGEIVLEGSPQVTRGKDVLTGKRITFYRDSDRMKVEGGSTLFLHQKEKGESTDDILGVMK